MTEHADSAVDADTLAEYRTLVREFVAREVAPHHAQWEQAGIVPRDFWRRAGDAGLVGLGLAEEHGGPGLDDFRFNAIVDDEFYRAGATGAGAALSVHNDVCVPYIAALATPEQSARWVPGLTSGELVAGIAMTEPGTGSDLRAIRTTALRTDEGWRVNGAKMFITNGINADLVITSVQTPDAGGISLLVLERGMPGFERGAPLKKVGLLAQDTAELFFTDVLVPRANLLGEEGKGLEYMSHHLAQERLAIGVQAVASVEGAFAATLEYAKQREAFGNAIGNLQANAFSLAEIATELKAAQVFLEWAITEHVADRLSAASAAMVKLNTTEMAQRALYRCQQLFGGYGFMREYPIARAWTDARILTIYGGTSEMMKLIVSRSLGLGVRR